MLRGFKRRFDIPIAAMLNADTMTHTSGASVSGATYEDAFNEQTQWVFTIAALLLTQIVPER